MIQETFKGQNYDVHQQQWRLINAYIGKYTDKLCITGLRGTVKSDFDAPPIDFQCMLAAENDPTLHTVYAESKRAMAKNKALRMQNKAVLTDTNNGLTKL